jgi:hypothetical protein
VAGYSGTPLAKKLGIRAGARLFVRAPPGNYAQLVDDTWSGLKLVVRKAARAAPARGRRA